MKHAIVIITFSALLLVGAGCQSSDTSSSKMEPKADTNGFIDRREAEPPAPPANVPPPTFVQPETTTTSE